MNAVDPKDPGETKVYTMDWTTQLASGATVSTSTWSTPGLTQTAAGIVAGSLQTSVTLSGGTDGQDYPCTNTVATSDGETLVQTGVVRVRATDRVVA